ERARRGHRRGGGREAEPHQDQAGARPAGRHDPRAGHVRAGVRLHLRWRHRPLRRRGGLPRVPHRGDLRPDRRVRGDDHRRRAGRGRPQGDHRPVPVAADGALGGAHRAHPVRRAQQRHRARRDVADGPAGRLADQHLVRRGAARLRAAAGLRLRHLVGVRVGRPAGAEPRGHQQRLVHRDLPAHVPGEHVRPAGHAARPRPRLRRVEPHLRGHAGGARPVRQPRPQPAGRRADGVAAAEPGALHADLGRGRPARVRAAGQPPVPPGGEPL
ncbi:MAG: Efflux ABC transporter, permease protein, partial [uncultured Pseudonocardia sp.]